MENISKALIIVGGILLAILILSLMVLIYNKISIIPQEQEQQFSEKGIIEYNRSFEVYQKPLMYGTDIISVINKAVDHNMRNGLLVGSNWFEKPFVDPNYGELMIIEARLKARNITDLDLKTRVRVYYINKQDDGSFREMEYTRGKGPENKYGSLISFSEALSEVSSNQKEMLRSDNYSGVLSKNFVTEEYNYNLSSSRFFKEKYGSLTLIAGDPNADADVNRNLMEFLRIEPITILNPKTDAESKAKWSKVVIIPASSKLKQLIFRSVIEETEYYQNGRIKKMCFEEN